MQLQPTRPRFPFSVLVPNPCRTLSLPDITAYNPIDLATKAHNHQVCFFPMGSRSGSPGSPAYGHSRTSAIERAATTPSVIERFASSVKHQQWQ